MKTLHHDSRGRDVRGHRSSDRGIRDGGAGAGGAAPPVANGPLLGRRPTLKIDARNRTFSPQYPLWSDGATKRRWVRLPAGSQINVADLEKWELPVGTKFWKEFSFKGRKVETRFLWQTRKDTWVFASYAWNEAQTDAVLASENGIADIADDRRRQAAQHPVGHRMPLVPRLEPHRDPRLQRAAAVDRSRSERAARRAADAAR